MLTCSLSKDKVEMLMGMMSEILVIVQQGYWVKVVMMGQV